MSIEAKIAITNQPIADNKQWKLNADAKVVVNEPIRITKSELQSGVKLNYWNNRLAKRQEKLQKGIESWTKKFGEDKSIWPPKIQEKANWRQNLVESASNRISVWAEKSKNAVEKVEKIFGKSIDGVENVIVNRPINGVNTSYTMEFRDAGGYKAPFFVEQPESSPTIGVIKPQFLIDSGNAWLLAEEDKQGQAQDATVTGLQGLRATRAGMGNPIFSGIDNGTDAAKGYSNSARVIGKIAEKYAVINRAPDFDLLSGGMYEVINANDEPDAIYLRALTLIEYRQTLDLMGKGAVLDALLDMQEKGTVQLNFMPQVRK